jgi:cytochrome c551/c552
MKVACTILAALVAVLAGCSQKPPAPVEAPPVGPVAVASIQEIMKAVVEPASNGVWKPPASIADPTAKATPAQKDADWLAVRHAAVALSESANLLVMPGRKTVAAGGKIQDEGQAGNLPSAEIQKLIESDPAAFRKYAKALQDATLETMTAIDAKNADALIEKGGKIDEACEACHLKYWYPPAATASSAPAK